MAEPRSDRPDISHDFDGIDNIHYDPLLAVLKLLHSEILAKSPAVKSTGVIKRKMELLA